MMKRLFATLLALTMALSLAACGGSKGTTPAEDTSDTQEPAAEEPTDKELSGDLVLYSSTRRIPTSMWRSSTAPPVS